MFFCFFRRRPLFPAGGVFFLPRHVPLPGELHHGDLAAALAGGSAHGGGPEVPHGRRGKNFGRVGRVGRVGRGGLGGVLGGVGGGVGGGLLGVGGGRFGPGATSGLICLSFPLGVGVLGDWGGLGVGGVVVGGVLRISGLWLGPLWFKFQLPKRG